MAERRLRVLLVVSLALNLLVAGIVIGARLSGGPLLRGVPQGPGSIVSALDRSELRDLRHALSTGEARPSRRELRAEMRALADLVDAEPFDAAAFGNRLKAMEERRRRGQSNAAAALASVLARATPERRAEIAEAMRRGTRARSRGR